MLFEIALLLAAQHQPPPPIITPTAPPPIVRTVREAPTYGRWQVVDADEYTGAYTGNDSGSVFGVLCGKTCVFYLNPQIECEEAHYYPAMVNSQAGSLSIQLRCNQLEEGQYVLTVMHDAIGVDVLKVGGEIGFAVPLASGRFAVSRFSLSGGLQAATEAATRAERRASQSQQGLRDFTI